MDPKIKVGIQFSPIIRFHLNCQFRHVETGLVYEGQCQAHLKNNTFELSVNGQIVKATLPVQFEPVAYETADFTLLNVTIGINFHWERQEDQKFKGALHIICEDETLTAINVLNLEDYLISVISSEMSATSSAELLKAHAVISRSWLLAQMEKSQKLIGGSSYVACHETSDARIKWYDREDHANFDVCADDHCQRYHGITKASTQEVNAAIVQTYGKVLTFDDVICDARFSKCCGGVTELFENAWEPIHHPYLVKVVDGPKKPNISELDLTLEANAEKWIKTNPDAYCNTTDQKILTQVLNDYDQETPDFYRWEKTYAQEKVQQLLKDRIGVEVGQIVDFIPVQRGASSRLIQLKIVGTKATKIIGKELEIRKGLSDSHLYSSAFVVEKGEIVEGVTQSFKLIGAGWGHGVGLCQIGAAVMSAKGFGFEAILQHYFKGAKLEKRY